MPDWSYQTVLRPLLFSLPPEQARTTALRLMGGFARVPLGPQLIDFLGHSIPPQKLATQIAGIKVLSPVGLGAGLDINAIATNALARFGFGFIEIGPVTEKPISESEKIARQTGTASLVYPNAPVNDGVNALASRLNYAKSIAQPIGFRLALQPGSDATAGAQERCRMIEILAPYASFFSLDTRWGIEEWSNDEWRAHLRTVSNALQKARPDIPLWISTAPDAPIEKLFGWLEECLELNICTVLLSGGIKTPSGSRLMGGPTHRASVERVSDLKSRFCDRLCIIASGGILEPADGLRLLDAGASLIQVHSGLIFTGPGLPKRINEAVLARTKGSANQCGQSRRMPSLLSQSWFWMFLLGLSMILGGLLAIVIAATRVVLPYDEAFVGLTPAGILRINSRLLHFMTHDRITLAGTMTSIGVLYSGLALYGARAGAHWAWKAICVSALTGFSSFFLFLGFGYFDPLHALVSALLFVIFLFGLRNAPRGIGHLNPDLQNDRAWRLAQWGQLFFVMIGIGLIVAGAVIALVGITRVFVPTDLMFLQTTSQAITSANSRLLPLIAHDRAGFGGALVSDGLAVLLLSLWGFRRGASWVWNTLLLAGLPGFVCALGVHIAIGYMCFEHLVPLYISSVLFVVGLALSRSYLCHLPSWPPA